MRYFGSYKRCPSITRAVSNPNAGGLFTPIITTVYSGIQTHINLVLAVDTTSFFLSMFFVMRRAALHLASSFYLSQVTQALVVYFESFTTTASCSDGPLSRSLRQGSLSNPTCSRVFALLAHAVVSIKRPWC